MFLEIFNPPIQPGANAFIWIVVILIGFIATMVAIDNFTESKKSTRMSKEKKIK